MKVLIFLFISSILQINLFAQTNFLKLDNPNIQTGIDYKNQNYLVFNGFDSYYQKPFISKKWQIVDYKFNELPKSKDFPYEFFQIKGKNYLVYSGCGTVYEFRNDSIVRIDNSFEHKNQFYASSFVYNNEIYFFGGYGLFTFKNILTKFDFKTKEWELIKYSDYSNIPSPRGKSISFLDGDTLYIISGYTEINSKQLIENGQQLFDIWELNLKTKVWEFLGHIKSKDLFKSTLNKGNSYNVDGNLYSDDNRLIGIDIENNKLVLYRPDNKFAISFGEKYNKETREIIYALPNTNDSNINVKIIIEPFTNYGNRIVGYDTIFQSNSNYYFLGIFCLIILILVFVFRKRLSIKPKNTITYKKDGFYYKTKAITNLTTDENVLLTFLFENKNRNVLVSELIDIVSDDNNTNYNTLSKKKDLVFNSLRQKLGFILNIDENDLFILTKNHNDKRIKEIRLNPEYFNT